MDFISELNWRNLLQDHTPGIKDRLKEKPITGYIGFDPTAPSLTIGNYVQVLSLRRLQLSGHSPIILMGGATGRIGDPSGKDKERTLKSYDELDRNLAFQQKQMEKYFEFEGPAAAQIVNNHDFYDNMGILEFLRDVGKTLTVNYMMSKDSVKNRLDTGLSFTEFSYQLLQAYDYQVLFSKYNCELQMGGSDQWGNITSGTEFIRRNIGGKAYAITTPLLTKSDGKKFGKSEKGNIWLDPEMTTPYEFYQFWINADDEDLSNYFRTFSFKTQEEILGLEKEFENNPQALKLILAEEITTNVHSSESCVKAKDVSNLLFNKNATKEALQQMDEDALNQVARAINSFTVDINLIKNGVTISDLVAEHTEIIKSKGDVRRAIKNNALAINKEKVKDHEKMINSDFLLHGKYIMIENGKKNKFVLKAE